MLLGDLPTSKTRSGWAAAGEILVGPTGISIAAVIATTSGRRCPPSATISSANTEVHAIPPEAVSGQGSTGLRVGDPDAVESIGLVVLRGRVATSPPCV